MTLLRFIARTIFANVFVIAGYDSLTNPGGRVALVSDSLPLPAPELLVRINGGTMLAAGAALALGRRPRLAAVTLAAAMAPTTYVAHRYWKQSDPALQRAHKVHFQKNLSLIGGLLTYALTDDG